MKSEQETKKQNYLFVEIIEKSYDPEKFQNYLLQKKAGGDDLQNWKLDQLKDVVKEFQDFNDGKTGVISKDTSSKQSQDVEVQQVEQQKRPPVRLSESQDLANSYLQEAEKQQLKQSNQIEEFDDNSNSEIFSRTINCVPIKPSSLLTNNNVKSYLTKFQKKEGGMFQQSFVSYFITTPFLDKTVERRYSDFEWLKETLRNLHPGLPIPPIAKKGQFRRYDQKHLNKRMMMLEQFIAKMMEIPQLRGEQLVQNFLKIDNRAEFEKMKASYQKTKGVIPLKSIKNTKGKLYLGFDSKINNFLVKTQKYITGVQPEIRKYLLRISRIYKEFKGAATSLEQSASILNNITKICDNIDKKQYKFRKQCQLNYNSNNFFNIMSQSIGKLQQQIISQANLFRTQVYSLLRYESMYLLNINENFETLATLQGKYEQVNTALNKKKIKLFEQGNRQKWQLQQKLPQKCSKIVALKSMLPKQSKKQAKIRDLYGLFNFQMFEQLNRHFNTKNGNMGSSLQNICKKYTQISSQLMMIWVDTQTSIMSMKENKYIQKC